MSSVWLMNVAFALFAVGFLTSCAESTVSVREGPRAFSQRDYHDVYDRWTRKQAPFAFNEMAEILHVTATFESWEFRWAYVARYAHDYALSASEEKNALNNSIADARQHHRFFVTLSGRHYRESDLTNNRSAWRVMLYTDDGRRVVLPLSIESIRKPTALEKTYFPSISPLRWTFRITFPAKYEDGRPIIGSRTRKLILRFTGAEGTVNLTWALSAQG